MGKGDKIGECFGQNRCIMVIDRFGGYRTDDEPLIVGDGQLFFTFLMFVSRIPMPSPLFLRRYLTHHHEVERCQVDYQADVR